MGDTELTLERDDVDDERIEEIVELERDLAETRRRSRELDDDDDDSESEVSPQITDPRVAVTGTVTDIERVDSWNRRDKAELTVRVDGEEHEFEFAWPDPADFDDNDLVRLLRAKGIDPDRLADLRGRDVTVLPTADGEYELRIPQTNVVARGIHWLAAKACRYGILALRDKDIAFERKLRPTLLGWAVLPALSAAAGFGLLTVSTPATTVVGGIGAIVGFLLAGIGGTIVGLEIAAVVLLTIVFTLIKLNEKVWPF